MDIDMILFGDSLTFGFGVPKKDSWAYKLQKQFNNIIILNNGINGDTTSSMLTRFYKDVTSKKPKKVFIMAGTNDLLSGRSIDYIVGNIELMIKDSLSIGASVIIGIPPIIMKDLAEDLFMPSNYYNYCEESLPLLREKIISLQKKYPFKYADFYNLTKNHIHEWIFLDGIHLNSLGNELLFRYIMDVI